MKKSHFLISSDIFLIIIFIIWTLLVANNSQFINDFDDLGISLIYQNHSNSLLLFFRSLTQVGGTIMTIIITLIFLAILSVKKYYYAAAFLLTNKLSMVIVNTLIKHLIQRPRPDQHHFMLESTYSYPSGHASSAFSLYIPLLVIGIFIVKKIGTKIIISTLAVLMAIIIGYSRIYLGVHYPSDIIGAYLLAAFILITTIYLFRMKNIFVLDLKGIQQQSNHQQNS
ncbi:phosphatase PAP2 family protein [Companilactobacillus versmoldensis]|uniref:phosphatase PAP2 family protein n=1 Tax=Companilactobacillus versmoldensis TaxID=194326 RepID=UPI000704BE42